MQRESKDITREELIDMVARLRGMFYSALQLPGQPTEFREDSEKVLSKTAFGISDAEGDTKTAAEKIEQLESDVAERDATIRVLEEALRTEQCRRWSPEREEAWKEYVALRKKLREASADEEKDDLLTRAAEIGRHWCFGNEREEGLELKVHEYAATIAKLRDENAKLCEFYDAQSALDAECSRHTGNGTTELIVAGVRRLQAARAKLEG
jgi:uncharacterized protein YdcH (DUF465 family)